MLRHQNYVPSSGGFDGPHPLVDIELSRGENFGICCAIAPFVVHESIRAKMNQHSEFQILPLDLLRGRLDLNGILRLSHWCEKTSEERHRDSQSAGIVHRALGESKFQVKLLVSSAARVF